jgi:hypothetical protein
MIDAAIILDRITSTPNTTATFSLWLDGAPSTVVEYRFEAGALYRRVEVYPTGHGDMLAVSDDVATFEALESDTRASGLSEVVINTLVPGGVTEETFRP